VFAPYTIIEAAEAPMEMTVENMRSRRGKHLSNATRGSNGVIIANSFQVETRAEGSSRSVFV
jgi:hypothetical protein